MDFVTLKENDHLSSWGRRTSDTGDTEEAETLMIVAFLATRTSLTEVNILVPLTQTLSRGLNLTDCWACCPQF